MAESSVLRKRYWPDFRIALPNLVKRCAALSCELLRAAWKDRPVRLLVFACLGVDLAFGLGTLLAVLAESTTKISIETGIFRDPNFRVTEDGGVPEIYGYFKLTGTIVLLLALWQRLRQPIYAALALMFTVILADDALTLHEAVGAYAAAHSLAPGVLGLRPNDLGEMSVYFVWLTLFVGVAYYTVPHSGPSHRDTAIIFAAIIGALAFFGFFVDMTTMVIYNSSVRVARMVGVVEDGGELVALTLALALAAVLYRRAIARA